MEAELSIERDRKFDAAVAPLRELADQAAADQVRRSAETASTAAALSPDEIAELIVGARQVRNRHFGARLFGEPAWDILLHLYIAQSRGEALRPDDAVTVGDTALSTGLRWLRVLEERGMIERRRDDADAGRLLVELTPAAFDKMSDYVASFTEWLGSRATLRRL